MALRTCRGKDADRIAELLQDEAFAALMNYLREGPRLASTIGVLARKLNRGVRYVHSLVKDDGRFTLKPYYSVTNTEVFLTNHQPQARNASS